MLFVCVNVLCIAGMHSMRAESFYEKSLLFALFRPVCVFYISLVIGTKKRQMTVLKALEIYAISMWA